jgi:3-dehydroquinate synthetase
VAGLLERLGLPVRVAAPIDPEQVVRAMGSDKKNRGATLRFALPRELGAMDEGERWTRAAPEGAIREALGVIA